MTGPTISAVVLTGNVERHLAACLRCLSWADEVMVLDGGSRDRTVAIAEAAGARVERRPFDDFAHQRQAALDRARGDWVLFVDDDERVSAGLAAEVRAAAASGRAEAYWVPRRNYIWGRWIRGGGWFPDAQLRLLRRDRARYDLGGLVHEVATDRREASARSAARSFTTTTRRSASSCASSDTTPRSTRACRSPAATAAASGACSRCRRASSGGATSASKGVATGCTGRRWRR